MNTDNQDSSPLRLLACSVLYVGILAGVTILFTYVDAPVGEIAIGIMVVSAITSMLILRNVNTTSKTK